MFAIWHMVYRGVNLSLLWLVLCAQNTTTRRHAVKKATNMRNFAYLYLCRILSWDVILSQMPACTVHFLYTAEGAKIIENDWKIGKVCKKCSVEKTDTLSRGKKTDENVAFTLRNEENVKLSSRTLLRHNHLSFISNILPVGKRQRSTINGNICRHNWAIN